VKARRQMKILELIRQESIQTQEELAERLRSEGGIDVTQATISRDIKELHLVKVPDGRGRYRYALPDDQPSPGRLERMRRIFVECVIGIDSAENLILVKSLSGTAAAVGEAIDRLGWSEVVGTIAGDNTVLVVVRDRRTTPKLEEKLRQLL